MRLRLVARAAAFVLANSDYGVDVGAEVVQYFIESQFATATGDSGDPYQRAVAA